MESPTFGGATFGAVGAYERIEGTITGEVDPKNPLNADIVDIGLAPKNADGKVGYSADFQILRPIDLSKGNHRVLFDLPNRGRATALTTLNDSKTANDTTSAGDPGNGFLMNQGYTLVEGAWDITAPQGGKLFGVTLPVAKNKDGSTITGPATEEFVIDQNATAGERTLDLSGGERRQVEGVPDGARELRRQAAARPVERLGLHRRHPDRGQAEFGEFRRRRLVRADRPL